MKNNLVYLDPQDIETSMRQLVRFYRLDDATMLLLRRIVEQYPRSVIMYVDEANAPLFASSQLDDMFTFNMETGELVLFSADPSTFINAMIEMWMYVEGFETRMGVDDYWEIEFAIGAWKPVKNNIKQRLEIPVDNQIQGVVGLPPTEEEAMLEDPYPFKTLVSSLSIVSFTQMVRLAGHEEVRVHFPPGTNPRVIEVYFTMKRAMKDVGRHLDITDSAEFNRRLEEKIKYIRKRYQPEKLPVPEEWQSTTQDRDAASSPDNKDETERKTSLLLGPPQDEPEVGKLPGTEKTDEQTIDEKLARGPFGAFIETLFPDED